MTVVGDSLVEKSTKRIGVRAESDPNKRFILILEPLVDSGGKK